MDFKEEDGKVLADTSKLLGYMCYHCFAQVLTVTKLKSHILAQHLGPVNCKMCGEEQEDLQELHIHTKRCSYKCGVDGCEKFTNDCGKPKATKENI